MWVFPQVFMMLNSNKVLHFVASCYAMSLKRRMCSRVIFIWRRDVPKTGNKTENSNLGAATEK